MARQGCPCSRYSQPCQCSQDLSGQVASRPFTDPNIKSCEGMTAFCVDRDHFVSQNEAEKPTGATDSIEQHPCRARQPAVLPDAQEGQSHKHPHGHINYTSSLPLRTYGSSASRMKVKGWELPADAPESSVAACTSPKKPMYDLDNVLRQEDQNPLPSSDNIVTDFDFDNFLTKEADESGVMTSLQTHDQDSQPRPEEQPAHVQMRGPQLLPHGNHAFQDYQVQLMLLEQQNKKRLLLARGSMAIAKQEKEKEVNSDDRPDKEIHQECKAPVTEGINAYTQSHDLGKGPASRTSNHALRDYQMQLMLLEQQDIKRVQAARQAEALAKEEREKEAKSGEQLRETVYQQYAKTDAFARIDPKNLDSALQDYSMQLMLLEQHRKKQALLVKDKQHESSTGSQADPKAQDRHGSSDALNGDGYFCDEVRSRELPGDTAVKADLKSLNRESCEVGRLGKEEPPISQESQMIPVWSQMAQSNRQKMLQLRQQQQMQLAVQKRAMMLQQQQQRQQANLLYQASKSENLQGVPKEATVNDLSKPATHNAMLNMQAGLGRPLHQAQIQQAPLIRQQQSAQKAAHLAKIQATHTYGRQQAMMERLHHGQINQMHISRAKDSTEQTQTIPKPQTTDARCLDKSQAHEMTQKNHHKQDCDHQAADVAQQQQQPNVPQSPGTGTLTDGHWRRTPLPIDSQTAAMSNLRTFNSYLHRTVKEQKQTISKLQTRLQEQDAQLAIMYGKQQAGGDSGMMPKHYYSVAQGGPVVNDGVGMQWVRSKEEVVAATADDGGRRVRGRVGDEDCMVRAHGAAASFASKGSEEEESDDEEEEEDDEEDENGNEDDEPSNCDDVDGDNVEQDHHDCTACNLLMDWDLVDVPEKETGEDQ